MKIVLFALVLANASLNAHAGSTQEAAKMVTALHLGDNLPLMAAQIGKSTVTYRGIVGRIGESKADALFKAKLSSTAAKYQPSWNQNLATAWAPLMSDDEFRSLATTGRQSPYASKFMSLKNQAGSSMEATSKGLVMKMVADALEETSKEVQ